MLCLQANTVHTTGSFPSMESHEYAAVCLQIYKQLQHAESVIHQLQQESDYWRAAHAGAPVRLRLSQLVRLENHDSPVHAHVLYSSPI